jgi:prepilin-type N-terminal cleavage/methylation domain-containing protein
MKSRGFTLIELLIVIAIICIIGSVITSVFTGDSLYQPAPHNAVQVPSPTP